MKVILSIDPVRFPLTGIGRYTLELARHLKEISEIQELRLLSGYRFTQLPCSEEVSSSVIRGISTRNFQRSFLKNPLTIKLYSSLFPLMKSYALKDYSKYVFHGPNFYLPPFKGPSVCTFHDLSVFTWAYCHPPERVRYMRKEIALTLKRADMLITDSDCIRLEVANYFGWPLNKIRVVPLACSGAFHPRAVDELNPVLEKYALTFQGYSLYVGTIEPRKNLDTLLDAYTLLPNFIRQKWPLVLIGYQGWRSEKLHARIKAAVSEGWALYLGFVSSDELPLLYAGARIFVFPSHYEGFGLPVLEAMASGIPVVCSNASALKEVVGDAAGICEPQDVESLRDFIVSGLEDDSWRSQAIKKGLVQAFSFSWERCAKETMAVYKELI
jgi:alpha-1,3-rhamnosyl/mannosyltransferase